MGPDRLQWRRLTGKTRSMKDIAIYGAGGFGREVACLINIINKENPSWNLIGFFDDDPELSGENISHYGQCLGGIKDLNAYNKEISIVVAIGTPSIIKNIVEKVNNPHVSYPNLIHPSIDYSDFESFKIGKGNIIQAHCTMSCDVTLGDFNMLNGSVVLGHDVKVGSFNAIMPAVRVSGEVTIGDENFFGVGSIVLQQLKIGNKTRLSAGSVLVTKPKEGQLYIGNPARMFKF